MSQLEAEQLAVPGRGLPRLVKIASKVGFLGRRGVESKVGTEEVGLV